MKYGIGLLASAVPTARTAAGCPISRAIQPYGRTWPRGISSVLCSTCSANPAGAFTSPSRFRSIITVAMVFSSEHFQAAMDVGLDRPHRLSERVGDFGIRELLHVPQHHRLAVPRRQARHTRGELVDLRPPQHVLLRSDPPVGLAAVELDQPRPHAPHAVADHVDRDPVQPGTLLELAYALGRVPGERFVGAQKRVLRHLLGVMPVAGQRQPERVDPVLVVPDEALEDALRTFHRPPKHTSLPPGCKGAEP